MTANGWTLTVKAYDWWAAANPATTMELHSTCELRARSYRVALGTTGDSGGGSPIGLHTHVGRDLDSVATGLSKCLAHLHDQCGAERHFGLPLDRRQHSSDNGRTERHVEPDRRLRQFQRSDWLWRVGSGNACHEPHSRTIEHCSVGFGDWWACGLRLAETEVSGVP